MGEIRSCSMDHVSRYGEIYAKAFSGELFPGSLGMIRGNRKMR